MYIVIGHKRIAPTDRRMFIHIQTPNGASHKSSSVGVSKTPRYLLNKTRHSSPNKIQIPILLKFSILFQSFLTLWSINVTTASFFLGTETSI